MKKNLTFYFHPWANPILKKYQTTHTENYDQPKKMESLETADHQEHFNANYKQFIAQIQKLYDGIVQRSPLNKLISSGICQIA